MRIDASPEAASSGWNSSIWEDLILRLLSETIKIVNDDEWVNILGDQYTQQLSIYNTDPDMKVSRFLSSFT